VREGKVRYVSNVSILCVRGYAGIRGMRLEYLSVQCHYGWLGMSGYQDHPAVCVPVLRGILGGSMHREWYHCMRVQTTETDNMD